MWQSSSACPIPPSSDGKVGMVIWFDSLRRFTIESNLCLAARYLSSHILQGGSLRSQVPGERQSKALGILTSVCSQLRAVPVPILTLTFLWPKASRSALRSTVAFSLLVIPVCLRLLISPPCSWYPLESHLVRCLIRATHRARSCILLVCNYWSRCGGILFFLAYSVCDYAEVDLYIFVHLFAFAVSF